MAKTALWILAVVVTLASAAWQRLSGPTHPARGEVAVKPLRDATAAQTTRALADAAAWALTLRDA